MNTNHTPPRPLADENDPHNAIWTTLMLQAMRISDRHVVCEIECSGDPVQRGGLTWYDVTAWLSRDEHAQEHVDQALEVMAYATRRNLIVRHPFDHNLVRPAVAGDGLAFSRAFIAASRQMVSA